MSLVVTQPRPREDKSRSVAPMSFPLWSIAGKRELTRSAAGLVMGIGSWVERTVRIEQALTDYERLLNTMQPPFELLRGGPLHLRGEECESQRERRDHSRKRVIHGRPPSSTLRRGSSVSAARLWRASRHTPDGRRPPRRRRGPSCPCRRAPSRAPTGTASRCPGGRSSP